MADPLYDAHGHTIQHPDDHHHTDTEINEFIDGILDIPSAERGVYFEAVRTHWNFHHFGEGGDNVNIKIARDGTINVQTLPFDYGDATGYEGLDIAPLGTTE